jgi:hypothetical protein
MSYEMNTARVLGARARCQARFTRQAQDNCDACGEPIGEQAPIFWDDSLDGSGRLTLCRLCGSEEAK